MLTRAFHEPFRHVYSLEPRRGSYRPTKQTWNGPRWPAALPARQAIAGPFPCAWYASRDRGPCVLAVHVFRDSFDDVDNVDDEENDGTEAGHGPSLAGQRTAVAGLVLLHERQGGVVLGVLGDGLDDGVDGLGERMLSAVRFPACGGVLLQQLDRQHADRGAGAEEPQQADND